MFETIQPAPPDAILGLNEAFQADRHPGKINLSVGQYQDDQGVTPILRCVKAAEQQLLERESSKGYLGIVGDQRYDQLIPALLLGDTHAHTAAGRVVTMQAPGGTGALRVAADFVHSTFPEKQVWLSNPTWPNHPNIFLAAGVPIKTYEYYDPAAHALSFDAMLQSLSQIPSGDVVVLHGCCHNPTGVDLDEDQWRTVSEVIATRGLLPLVDFAYQGLGSGLAEDALGLQTLCEHVDDLLVCSSYSKNFGLYCERVGALTVTASNSAAAKSVTSHIKQCIRANYSNPPAHGAAIVAEILANADLRTLWKAELDEMRERILSLRQSFVTHMRELNSPVDFSFITHQRGMFSFSGLSPQQVEQLREQHSIYIVRNGRINVAGMSRHNIAAVCEAIVKVMAA